jgi:3-hydroxyacyl-[acyl-carrier-protein] dehydratase
MNVPPASILDTFMDLLDLLPHRPPMRLLDAIVDVVPGQSACGRRQLRADDFFFEGHFPGEPIVPAVILVEMIAQVGGLAVGAPESPEDQDQGAAPLRLRVAALGPFRFKHAARPGAGLVVQARVTGSFGGLFKVEGTVYDDGRPVAEGSVTLGSAGAAS